MGTVAEAAKIICQRVFIAINVGDNPRRIALCDLSVTWCFLVHMKLFFGSKIERNREKNEENERYS